VAVKLLKAELPWTCLGMAWLDEQQVQSVRQALTELMAEFDFASCVLFGRAVPLEKADQGRTGVQFRAAAYAQPGAEVLARLHGLLQLDGPQAMRYADARRQCSRAMAIGRQTESPGSMPFALRRRQRRPLAGAGTARRAIGAKLWASAAVLGGQAARRHAGPVATDLCLHECG
jgi:assimilatory nitrate reductase catalytic subunit